MTQLQSHTSPSLVVDAVLFQIIDGQLCVVLVERSTAPFENMWALPGGFNAKNETTRQALQRVVYEKAGIDLANSLSYIEQLYTFDTVERDPRGHAVSVTYMGCGRDIQSSSNEHINTFPVDKLPEIAYDHADIIKYAHKRLAAKLTYTNAVYAFLPKRFTLSELQSAYQIILGRELDKRNFRKKFLSLGLIHQTEEMKRDGAHRPARLFEFNATELEAFSRSFD